MLQLANWPEGRIFSTLSPIFAVAFDPLIWEQHDGIYNRDMKQLMLRHAFQFVNRVIFLIGVRNLRSQRKVQL